MTCMSELLPRHAYLCGGHHALTPGVTAPLPIPPLSTAAPVHSRNPSDWPLPPHYPQTLLIPQACFTVNRGSYMLTMTYPDESSPVDAAVWALQGPEQAVP